MMDTQVITNSVNWISASMDVFVLLAIASGIAVYSLFLGRDRVFIILISSYISIVLADKLYPFSGATGLNKPEDSFLNHTIIFLGGVLILFFILSNSSFTSIFDESPRGTWKQTVLVSLLQIGLMASIIVSFMPSQQIETLPVVTRTLLADFRAQLFWLLSPFIFMVISKGKF